MSNVIKINAMVDPHTHLRDLDWAHKATFHSETAAALAGGYWAIMDMPNTAPSTISKEALNSKMGVIRQNAVCDWGLYFGAAQSDNTADYAKVIDDVCGLKIYNNATTGNLLIGDQSLRDIHFANWPKSKLITVHAEERTVLDILELVRKYNQRVHFHHISTAEEIGYLQAAKEEGLPVTIGVCPHHLYLTEDDLPQLGGFGMMKPELKTKADRDALWAALVSGVVDVVESDHAPHTIEEKTGEKPAYGVPGLETTLPLMLLAVKEGRLSLQRVIELLSDNPRKIWVLNSPVQTYAQVDLDAEYTIQRANLHTKCGWSPFEGMKVVGKVTETWIRGQKVYDGEKVIVEPGFGQNLYG
jgi:dihydroorotase